MARPGGLSYLRIPAPDAAAQAAFYHAVFGWTTDGDTDMPNFADGTRHVIGHFQPDLPVAGDAGVRPYIYVEGIDETLERSRRTAGRSRCRPSRKATCGWHSSVTRPGTSSAYGSKAQDRNQLVAIGIHRRQAAAASGP